jgi:nifR3 family TIM-barrel protein
MLDRCVKITGRQQVILASTDADDHPVAAQLIGNDPHEMAGAAVHLAGQGFDVVDLNFACPVNKALKRRRGGYLMQHPETVLAIVRAVVAAVENPVTLKLRQSFGRGGSTDPFWQIAEGARRAGVAGICVHGRSVEQKYSGPADWEFLAHVAERFPDWTVLGSGDVKTPDHALRMLEQTGVHGVAVARGGLGNPWFFRQVRCRLDGREPDWPSLAEQRKVIAEHFDEAIALYGPKKGPRIMRKWGIRYARMHPTPKAVRMAFVAVKSADDWHGVLERLYTPDQERIQ